VTLQASFPVSKLVLKRASHSARLSTGIETTASASRYARVALFNQNAGVGHRLNLRLVRMLRRIQG